MDALIKLATSNPITAIIIIGIGAISSKYAWSYWTKRDINLTNYKIAELDFKNQIESAFSAINNIKREVENHDNEIDLLQKRLNTFDAKIEVLEDKIINLTKAHDDLKDHVQELKDETNNKFKRYDKKFKIIPDKDV
jgi:chromosome segregation ATPase